MPSSWENVKVGNSSMPLYVSVPESGGPVPGIVVVHGQSGLEDFIKNTTHMLALQGYTAVAPNLYHRDAPECKDDNPTRKSRLRDTGIISDISAAIGFLKNHSRVDSGRLGIVGFCMGGRIVYLMSAASRDLKAGVMFYGGGTMVPFGEVHRHSIERARSIARFRGTSARTIRIHRPKTCASSLGNFLVTISRMSFIATPAQHMRSATPVLRTTGRTPQLSHGPRRRSFSAGIWLVGIHDRRCSVFHWLISQFGCYPVRPPKEEGSLFAH
jgi:Dienelactone hydrolase family